MSLKTKAAEGVLERVRGRKASRGQAVVAAIGAGAVIYRLLRSGSPGDEREGSEDGAVGGEEDGAFPAHESRTS